MYMQKQFPLLKIFFALISVILWPKMLANIGQNCNQNSVVEMRQYTNPEAGCQKCGGLVIIRAQCYGSKRKLFRTGNKRMRKKHRMNVGISRKNHRPARNQQMCGWMRHFSKRLTNRFFLLFVLLLLFFLCLCCGGNHLRSTFIHPSMLIHSIIHSILLSSNLLFAIQRDVAATAAAEFPVGCAISIHCMRNGCTTRWCCSTPLSVLHFCPLDWLVLSPRFTHNCFAHFFANLMLLHFHPIFSRRLSRFAHLIKTAEFRYYLFIPRKVKKNSKKNIKTIKLC